MTTNVSLTPELEKYLQKKVQAGGYKSVSEVVREALRLLKEKDQEAETKLKILKSAIQKGFDSGPSSLLDMDAIKKKARQRTTSSSKNK